MNNSIFLKPQPNACGHTLAAGASSIGVYASHKFTRHHLTNKRTRPRSSLFNSMWTGAVAGMVGISAVYPVDVIKTRIQNESAAVGAVQLGRAVLRSEGIGALYKGLLPQLCGTGPDKAISLGTRALINRMHQDPTSVAAIMTSAAGAGAAQSTVMSPVEIVKVRMQIDSSQSMRAIVRSLGLRGLYRGFSACFIRDVTFATTYFTLYDLSKQKLGIHDGSSLGWSLVAGVSAGVPAAGLTTPLDVVKTRMQAARSRPEVGYAATVRRIAQDEGVGAFFKGWAPRVARIAPQFGIVLVTFDFLNSRFN